MSQLINDNFFLAAPEPIDSRSLAANTEARNAIPWFYRYPGMQVYVGSVQKWFFLNAAVGGDLADNNLWTELGTIGEGNEGITLEDFSVVNSETPFGSGSLAYDNVTGIFTFTPPLIEAGGDFIPLSGTEVGSPVTGDIELTTDGSIISINQGDRGIQFNGDEELIRIYKNQTFVVLEDRATQIGVFDGVNLQLISISEDGLNGIIINDSIDGVGLKGFGYYGANYDDNTYVQKKYVDDNFLAIPTEGTNGQVLTTNGAGVYTWEDAGGGGGITLEGYSESGTRAGFDLNVIIGDYDNSSAGSKIDLFNGWKTQLINNYGGGTQRILLGESDSGVDIGVFLYTSDTNFVSLLDGGTPYIHFSSDGNIFRFTGSFNDTTLKVNDFASSNEVYLPAGSGTLALITDFITDPGSYSITPNEGNINLSGGSDGDVLTRQADGSLAFETPAGGGGIALTDLSVGAEGFPSANGSLSYDNTTGVFTYTPAALPTLASVLAEGSNTGGSSIFFDSLDRAYFNEFNSIGYIGGGSPYLEMISSGDDIRITAFAGQIFLDGDQGIDLTTNGTIGLNAHTLAYNSLYVAYGGDHENIIDGFRAYGSTDSGDDGTDEARMFLRTSRTWTQTMVNYNRQANIGFTAFPSKNTTDTPDSRVSIQWEFPDNGFGPHDYLGVGRLNFFATAADVEINMPTTSGTLALLSDIAGGGSTPSLAAVTGIGSTTASDIEITDPTKGYILPSPDNTRWRITIDNSGNLITTSL